VLSAKALWLLSKEFEKLDAKVPVPKNTILNLLISE